MNILLVTQEDILAGSTYSVSYLAKGLAARGHNVWVAARPGSVLDGLLKDSQVTFLPLTIKSRFDRVSMKLVKSWIDKYEIEIINAQSSRDRYITIFLRLFYGVKAKLFHTRRQYPLSAGGFLQRLLYVKGTDKIIVISNELKRIFIGKGFPANHLHVIHNGIPQSRYSQWNEDMVQSLRVKLGIAKDDIVIGSISRLKLQEQIIHAVVFLNRPDVKVLFAGIKNGHFDELCSKLNIKNQIIYAGEVEPQTVLNYYKLLSVNILASITDGFGLVLLESMAMGTPVVATNFGGIRDVVQDGYNGLLFDNGDHKKLAQNIEAILGNNQLSENLKSNGAETVIKFNMDNTITNYEKFFTEWIQKGTRA